VRGRTQASVGKIELATVGANVVFKVPVGVGGQLGAAQQRHGHVVDHAQVLEIFERVVLQLAVQAGRGGHADVPHQDGVTIRRRTCDLGGADGAAGACRVVDHDGRVAQMLAHRFGQLAGDGVGRAAGGERHHHGDGLGGEVLGGGGEGGREGHSEGQDLFHGRSPTIEKPIVGRPVKMSIAEIT